jgi:hypothetical protein
MNIKDDWREEVDARLDNSYVYQKFVKKCSKDSAGSHAITLVKDAVKYAYHRTKTIIRNMGEFTLHDGDHSFRVLRLMEKIITKKNINNLHIPELLLLILSAFFHDIGMAPEEKKALAWRKIWDSNPKFLDDEENREYELFNRFCTARPDRLEEIDENILKGNFGVVDLLKSYLISDYIRSTHGDRAKEIIEKDWSNKILYRDADLTVEFAEICFSHAEDALKILNLDRRYICGPDTFACLPIIAIVLRIADILDFDMKRTPSVLFSHLAVRHPVSLSEWGKHRSIESWVINENEISFQAKCSHPAIEASIHSFCDLIDRELSVCGNILNEINDFNMSHSRNLKIKIPFKVSRDKIVTRKDIFGKPLYNYRETRFDLSKNQVIELLMGTKLYGDPEVALRELLQNSIDACLLRQSLENKWGNLYEPRIDVKYYQDKSDFVLEVDDNGIGMDQYIIDNYYSKIGSSFYKSSDFYDLKSKINPDFTPTSRFGIGILSCFMVADSVLVDTRKLHGPHESSDSIALIIEGQDSIFWIKDGDLKTPGTQTKLVLRKNKNPWQRMSEDKFIKSVESIIPNPPFKVHIKTDSHESVRDQNSFEGLNASILKDYSWKTHENIKEIEIKLGSKKEGIVGSAIVGILEKHNEPVAIIDVKTKYVFIEGESYKLEKTLKLSINEIELKSTTISIDEDGNIEADEPERTLNKSKSRIALHGIEVPTTLFPASWEIKKNQVNISWPFPMLIIVDICGTRDLDLNSARNQIILSDNWVKFEEDLAKIICQGIANNVTDKYWEKLKSIFESTENENFLRGFREVALRRKLLKCVVLFLKRQSDLI